LIDQEDLIGFDVNLAARLLDYCRPDDVVVSEPAREFARVAYAKSGSTTSV
jgi:class 3 adenylate cyclase